MKMSKLFCDYDGVCAFFDELAEQIFGMPPQRFEAENGSKHFWRMLRNYRSDDGLGFFESLNLMPDAMELWDGIRHRNPIILTGCPRGGWAEPQKVNHAAKHFPGVNIITCMARDKSRHMSPGDVLIDDREKHRPAWEDAGGIWITHTSAKSSLEQLRALKPEWF